MPRVLTQAGRLLGGLVVLAALIAGWVWIGEAFADRSRIARFHGNTVADTGWDAGDILGNDQGVASDAGQDASFQFANASDDYVTCPDRAGFDSPVDGLEFSVGCWVRRTALENSEIIIGQTDTPASSDLKFLLQARDSTGGSTYDDVQFYVSDDTGSNWRSCSAVANMVVDTWYLIVGVFDLNAAATFEVTLSINGGNRGYSTCAGSLPTTLRNSAGDVKIGHYSDASNGAFAWYGQIADCYVWNEALTNAELTTLYNSGTPLPYASISPAPDFMLKGCAHEGTGGYPQVAPETGGADCVATNGPTCVSTYPP